MERARGGERGGWKVKRAHEGLFHQRRKREERGRGNPIQVWLLQGMKGKEEGSRNRKRQTPMNDV